MEGAILNRAMSLLATTRMDLEDVAVDDADDLDYG